LAGVGPLARVQAALPRGYALALRGRVAAWISASTEVERTRWPLWLPVALGTGVGLYFSLTTEPGLGIALAVAGIALVAAVLASTSRDLFARIVFSLITAVAVGFTVAKAREQRVAAPVLHERAGPLTLYGQVEYAQMHGKGVRVVLSHLNSRRLENQDLPAQIRISFRSGADDLRPGDRIRAMAVLMPPPGPAAPDAYDFARTAFFERIGAVGYAYGGPVIVSRAPAFALAAPLPELIERLRFKMTARIHEVLPALSHPH